MTILAVGGAIILQALTPPHWVGLMIEATVAVILVAPGPIAVTGMPTRLRRKIALSAE
jgi:hypothetical protein